MKKVNMHANIYKAKTGNRRFIGVGTDSGEVLWTVGDAFITGVKIMFTSIEAFIRSILRL